jgi:hypothetical protein
MAVAPAVAIPQFADPSFCKGQSDIQSGLMVVTVAAAVLSLIPPCRFVGATIMRSVAVVSSLDICQDNWRKPGADWKIKAIMCAKVAATGLGVAAIVASSPVLLIAALATDIAVQIFEMIKASSVAKKLLHLGFLAVNITVLTGIILVSWELLLAASIASTVAMLCLGIYIAVKAETWKDVVNMACYFALCGVGIASGVMVSRLTDWYEHGHYERDGVPFSGRLQRDDVWVPEYTEKVQIGGFLKSQYYNTLPIGTHAVVAAERVE